jgi:tetratricopeptide (TPR) repeat protein
MRAGRRLPLPSSAAEDPGNSLLQGNLDVAYIGLGDALLSAGKRQEALDIYLKGLAIREKLVISDPGNRDWQRQLIVNYLTIGDLQFNTGNRQEALATYRKCLAVAEKVAASDPSNLSWVSRPGPRLRTDWHGSGGRWRSVGGAQRLPGKPRHFREACRPRSRQHHLAARSAGDIAEGEIRSGT